MVRKLIETGRYNQLVCRCQALAALRHHATAAVANAEMAERLRQYRLRLIRMDNCVAAAVRASVRGIWV